MRSIFEYLSTKNIKSQNEIKFERFCKGLHLNANNKNAQKLFDYFKNDCDHVIGDNLEDEQRLSTDFELIYMVAAMLNSDSQESNYIYNIGFKDYKGKQNPYDFSWFEEENANGKTVLEIMQDLYSSNKKFRDIFDDVYVCINKSCENYENTIDDIWNLQNILEY
jgi:hypothetical protein